MCIRDRDIVRLMKYIANNGEGIEAYGTDLNNDNVTNSKDLVRLMKYIANGGSNSDDSSDISSSCLLYTSYNSVVAHIT